MVFINVNTDLYNMPKERKISLLLLTMFMITIISPTVLLAIPSQITLVSLNESNAVSALKSGKIELYATPLMNLTASNLKTYLVPVYYYDVLVNPLNTTFGFNPFQFQQVRFALNYIVNRAYFADDILHGYGIPSVSVYSGEPDVIHLLPVLAQYSNIHYNFTYANQTIYRVLTANGAQYIDGKWYYQGKPVTVYFLVNVNQPIENSYSMYLASQLEKLGFKVQEVTVSSQSYFSLLYESNPATTEWDIAIEAWNNIYKYYDAQLAAFLYSSVGGFSPFSSYYGLSDNRYNVTAYESSHFLLEANTIDSWSLEILNGEYLNETEYYTLENSIVNLGIQMAVRIGLGLSLTPIYTLPNISGIYPCFSEGTGLSFLTYIEENSSNTTIGEPYLTQGALNPVAGFTDYYSMQLFNALFTPPALTVPGTAYPLPYIFTYKIINITRNATIPVPSDAMWWNPEKQEITYVPPNTTAEMAVIYNFAPLFKNDKFVDGQNITLADIIYQYIVASEVSLNSSNPVYDPYASSIYSGYLQFVKGFKIVNSTAIEIWGNDWFFDHNYAAIVLFLDFNPLGQQYAGLGGGGYMPWQLYVAMKEAVAVKNATWSQYASESEGIGWLNLVNSTYVKDILYALKSLASSDYIPQSLLQVERLSGVTLTQQTETGYQDAINYIEKYGNALIGDGAFMLTSWNGTYAKLERNIYFNLTPPQQVLHEPTFLSINFLPSSSVYPNETLNGTVFKEIDGSTSKYPGSDVNVSVVLMTTNGSLIMIKQVATNKQGQFNFTLPELPVGRYIIALDAYSNTSIVPEPIMFFVTVPSSPYTTISTIPSPIMTITPPVVTKTVTITQSLSPLSNKIDKILIAVALISSVLIFLIFRKNKKMK